MQTGVLIRKCHKNPILSEVASIKPLIIIDSMPKVPQVTLVAKVESQLTIITVTIAHFTIWGIGADTNKKHPFGCSV
jgi:hypothetical protein